MFTIEDLLAATHGRLCGRIDRRRELTGVTVDSRRVQPGQLFVALPGQRQDGHDFVSQALASGAGCALVQRLPGTPPELGEDDLAALPLVVVDDSQQALQRLARSWRDRQRATVVGVTGSVGKTTTKETVASVLGQRYRVLKSRGNYNTEIGIPISLMDLDEQHDLAVLEMGMLALGEIRQLTEIARPEVGIVTNVQPTHLERLGTVARIAQAKSELVEALPPSGLAVLNADDPWVRAMARRSRAPVRFFGFSAEAEVWASRVVSRGLDGVEFELHSGRESIHVEQALVGVHGVYAALAAASVGLHSGLDLADIATALRQMKPGPRIRVEQSVAGARLIDDTYNANPESMLAALSLLSELDGRKIAVLGDMLELGSYEEAGHRSIGRQAARVVDLLVTVGRRGRIIAQAARAAALPAEQSFHAQTNEQAVDFLRPRLRRGDNVLVKGSRGMRLEEVVQALREDS